MITLLVLAACLLVIGLLFGRRFGLPILGLAAGLIIAQNLAATAVAVSAPYLSQYTAYVPAGIVVLPSLVLMLFMKGRHRTIIARVIGAVVFAAAGLAFVLSTPQTPASITGSVPPVVAGNLGLIVSGLLGLAVLEAVFGKASKKKLEEPKK